MTAIAYRLAIPALLLAAAPAMAQTKDHAPVALPSAGLMSQDKPGTESWTYAQPTSVFTKYRTVIVDPTTVYQGPDAQFDGVDPADRNNYAAIITGELRNEIAKTFPSPARPQADTLRLRVTILGATKTKGGLATATRVTPVGFGLSALKSALGKTGTLTGVHALAGIAVDPDGVPMAFVLGADKSPPDARYDAQEALDRAAAALAACRCSTR